MTTSKNLLYKKILFTTLLSFTTLITFGQQTRVNVDALTTETQKTLSDPERMTLVWWIPEEFWQAVFDQDPSVTKDQAEQIIKTFRPYTVLIIVDGKLETSANIIYKTEASIRSTAHIIDGQGVSYDPISKELINEDVKGVISIMNPILSNMLGKMGDNMCFVLFPSVNSAGAKIVDPRKEGSFSVMLGESAFKWALPLGSLIPPKICPVDNQELNGAWKFCPWHGAKLIAKENSKQ